jgi:hypothetical protein
LSKKFSKCDKKSIVSQLIRTQAQVTLKPIAKHGKPKVFCIDSAVGPNFDWDEQQQPCKPTIEDSDRKNSKCTFTITQLLCVEVPIEIDMDVDVDAGIIRCGKPNIGPCKPRRKDFSLDDENDEDPIEDEYEY